MTVKRYRGKTIFFMEKNTNFNSVKKEERRKIFDASPSCPGKIPGQHGGILQENSQKGAKETTEKERQEKEK